VRRVATLLVKVVVSEVEAGRRRKRRAPRPVQKGKEGREERRESGANKRRKRSTSCGASVKMK